VLGHISKDCPQNNPKKNKGKFHAHAVEEEKPSKKAKEESSDKEYVLISALTGSVSLGNDTWIVDSGASKHMTGFESSLSSLEKKESPHKVKLGDDFQYSIKGVGEASYKLDSGKSIRMKGVLFFPGLKKNLLSISALEKKGFIIAFVDGEVLLWPRGKTIEDVVVIGEEEGGLYKLKGSADLALIHNTVSPCELWHRRLAHFNYKALPIVSKVVTGLPKIQVDNSGVCKGFSQGKNVKNPLPSSDMKAEGILNLIHLDACGPMTASSLSGYDYYVSFIDDFSRKTWIYFLKSKDEVFSKF